MLSQVSDSRPPLGEYTQALPPWPGVAVAALELKPAAFLWCFWHNRSFPGRSGLRVEVRAKHGEDEA